MVSLARVAKSRDAVFAIDYGGRIIIWNAACEALLGHRAEESLGRTCWDVLCGKDMHGNVHCYENCPVVHQIRDVKDEPVRRFLLDVRLATGKFRTLAVSAYLVDEGAPSCGVIVHVLREERGIVSDLERRLHRLVHSTPAASVETGLRTDALTPREKEVLCCLAQGLGTPMVAEALGIEGVTVRNHVRSILQKLGVHTRFAAVAYAYKSGIVRGADAGELER